MEVTNWDSSGTRVKTFELDADGRVLVAEPWRYQYDLLGRLTQATHSNGTTRSWNYEASWVAENGREWTQEMSADRRRITLKRGKPEGKVVIWFDAEGRPEEVLSAEEEDWHLTYGGCPNAEHSSTRWLVHEVLDAWPFPEEPQAGDALEVRETWLRGPLPLGPF